MSELAPEERARADFYGLLARLFYAPADRALLDALASAGELPSDDASVALALAWRELARAAATASEDAVRDEYEQLFVGTGKADVSLYTTAYTIKSAIDNPLVEIRDFMARHGLTRKEAAFEPEDHIAALCEIMRFLVAEQQAPMGEQQGFFESYIGRGGSLLCAAIDRNARAVFYRHVAKFAAAFLQLEHDAFEIP
jgi:TorA maturation chaperone TorD